MGQFFPGEWGGPSLILLSSTREGGHLSSRWMDRVITAKRGSREEVQSVGLELGSEPVPGAQITVSRI